MKRKKSSAQMIIAFIIAALAAAVCVFLVLRFERTQAEPEAPAPIEAEAQNYISRMEAVDTTPIEDRIFEEENKQSVEELLAEFESNPDSIWKTLKDFDTLIMGDSRAQCFLIYDYMDDAHCLVTHSTTIYKIEEYLPEVEARKPRIIVISYGINDAGLYHDYGIVNYMNDFADLIKDLERVDPGVKIYVNSILPCLESEYERAPNWMVIPEWNAYIKNYCEEHGIGYIDATELCNQHRDLYIDDGVHLVDEFYPYWGALIAAQIASDMSGVRTAD